MTRPTGAPVGNQNARRHGLNALKARVKLRGLQAIDMRTSAAQALLAWRKAIVADLGGEAAISANQQALIELAVRTRLYLDSLDAWLMEQTSLVVRKKRETLPVLTTRQQLADALARYLQALGLERHDESLSPDLAAELARQGRET